MAAAQPRLMLFVKYQKYLNSRFWPDPELQATLMEEVRHLTTQSRHAGKGSEHVHPCYAACAVIGVMLAEQFLILLSCNGLGGKWSAV